MTRSEVIRAVALKTSLTQQEARDAIEAFVDTIAMAAREGEDTTIAGFGKFLVRDRPEAERFNPGTREKVVVPRRKTVTFRASKLFRDRI